MYSVRVAALSCAVFLLLLSFNVPWNLTLATPVRGSPATSGDQPASNDPVENLFRQWDLVDQLNRTENVLGHLPIYVRPRDFDGKVIKFRSINYENLIAYLVVGISIGLASGFLPPLLRKS